MTLFARWRSDGREIAVIGLARSGIAASELLRRQGIPVYASDLARGEETDQRVARLRAMGAVVETGGHDLPRIARAAAVVVSPGVPPDAPPLATASAAGVEIRSEIDVGAAGLPEVRFAAITGTNGKSTVTALVAHLLLSGGLRTVAAGNIGTPLSEVALRTPHPEWVSLEVSSFQLHDTRDLVPDVGLLTNLAPDHLDRYPSLEAYFADKRLLFLNARADSTWVLNGDDHAVLDMAKGKPGAVRLFSVAHEADAWYDRSAHRLLLDGKPLLERERLTLLGDHNVANALAAALVAARAGIAPVAIAEGLASFRALTHRLEPVREVNGVLWINDSKATNVSSTAVALDAIERPYVLLLGGRHKGEPYTALADRMHGRCRAVVAYGEAGDQVEHDLAGKVTVVRAGPFSEVLERARALTRPGDAVLLSPACSSYDMFKNYEDRGRQFRAAVEAM
ncbi:MAG TPA: UDP-N-acetylmuramoyl-L-alanine--D-glutamate ligase [Gemmatimonadales bacterium]|nr:UDP-N-acetylmuramoyl-L-alanine--D-glutamate ligase [Gemmatimonadales bacterium]